MPNYFTVKQASLILGFSTNSIYKFLNEGRLKGKRTGGKQGRFRISKTAIESFLGYKLDDRTLMVMAARADEEERSKKSPTPPPAHINQQTQQDTAIPTNPPIPLNITRGLIILCLLFILADILISQNFSILQQVVRFFFLSITIVIAYQYGDLTTSTSR